MIRIALDAMGGDHAPEVPVAGAVAAIRELREPFIAQLVGRTAAIEAALSGHSVDRSRIEVIEAPDTVGMAEKPLQAVRTKPKSSIVLGLSLQKAGESDAFVSAGNTGAVLAAATLTLRLQPGFARPAIGAPFPTTRQAVLVLDGGANVDCTAKELVGFAHLGVIYSRDVMGRENPAVGLLNIGEEEEKGNAATKEAHQLLAMSALRFVGNVEGRDILAGQCPRGPIDVVVCDGFVGNVLLKFYESVARLFRTLVAEEVGAEAVDGEAMARVLRVLDYAEYGGAPLLGVRGVAIICHGRSTPHAIKNALRVACQAARSHLAEHMSREFETGVPAG